MYLNLLNHLIVESKQEGIILSFVSLSIFDDLANIPVDQKGSELIAQLILYIFYALKHTTFYCFTYETILTRK